MTMRTTAYPHRSPYLLLMSLSWLLLPLLCEGWSPAPSPSLLVSRRSRTGTGTGSFPLALSTLNPRSAGNNNIPVDLFGDVNGFDEEEGDDATDNDESLLDYYDNDSAQTIFPYLDQWRLVQEEEDESYCLRGIVSNHPTHADGSPIATSTLSIASTKQVTAESLMTTVSGSQYLLGQELMVGINQWKLHDEQQLTGMVMQDYPHCELKVGQSILLDIIGEDELQFGSIVTSSEGHKYMLHTPSLSTISIPTSDTDKSTSNNIPLLQHWKRLEGGALAGFVSGHKLHEDGDLITTSPLTELDESDDNFILVTSATGSQYLLGDPEPPKEYYDEYDDEDDEEEVDYEELEEDDDDEDDMEDDEDDDDIPTFDIPPKHHMEEIIATAMDLHHSPAFFSTNNGQQIDHEQHVFVNDTVSAGEQIQTNDSIHAVLDQPQQQSNQTLTENHRP